LVTEKCFGYASNSLMKGLKIILLTVSEFISFLASFKTFVRFEIYSLVSQVVKFLPAAEPILDLSGSFFRFLTDEVKD
jgi:hypothetical protein